VEADMHEAMKGAEIRLNREYSFAMVKDQRFSVHTLGRDLKDGYPTVDTCIQRENVAAFRMPIGEPTLVME